jgi:hypothetical protein
MKDCFDVTSDVISLINVPEVLAEINGKIYADDRPDGSQAIDIVVNCLGINNTQNQNGSGNVNIYAKNLDSGRPNSIVLRRLCRLISLCLDGQYRDTFNVSILDAGIVYKDTDGSHFVNIPFNYRSIQTNFKKI